MPDNEGTQVTEEVAPAPSDNGAQAGATVEQEVSAETGATEAQEAESGDWRDTIRSLAQEDPELAKEMHSAIFEALPEDERKRYQPDAQVAEREHEAELRDLETQHSEALKTFTQRHMSLGPQTEQFVTKIADTLLKDLPDTVYDEAGTKLARPSVSKEAHIQEVGRLIAQAQAAQAEFIDTVMETVVRRSLVDTSAHKLLSPEQRKVLKEISPLDTGTMEGAVKWFSTMMGAYIDAALDSNPVRRAEAETQAAKAKADSAERLAGLMDKVNRRKTKVTAGVGEITGSPRTQIEADTLHIQGKITSAERRRIRNDPSIPEGI